MTAPITDRDLTPEEHASAAAARRVQLQQQEQQTLGAALAAFEQLFRYYSLNEELWRLERWMDDLLPYSLEDHPLMNHFRAQLTKQVGHLRLPGSARMTHEGVSRWYANGSPMAGVDEQYASTTTKLCLPPRFEWLIAQCRANGFKFVAEYGSVEGISLFHLIHHAPEIRWVGHESSAPAVARGIELAQKVGLADKFHLHSMEQFNQHTVNQLVSNDGVLANPLSAKFDAVALFEILEHNTWEGALMLVRHAAKRIRSGGMLFITTPHGNWSAFDPRTQDLNLPKDHILAFTPNRMLKLLTAALGPGEQEAAQVQNPTVHENNSWVFAARRM